MFDGRLVVRLAEGYETELRVQRGDVLLCMQQHRDAGELLEGAGHQKLRETFAAAILTHHDPTDDVVGVEVIRRLIFEHAQVGRGSRGVDDPVVARTRLLIAVVEFFFVDLLLDEEHIRSQFQDGVQFGSCEFAPRAGDDGTFGHDREFNTGEDCLPVLEEKHMTYKVEKTEQEWRNDLGDRYSILREAATERPWSGALLDEKREGTYTCGACTAELFTSGAKFDSGSGWPSFFESVNPDAVELKTDKSLGMIRTEVVCGTCGSHLGHLFDDASQTPTGDRFCMNSLSLGFKED